MNSEDPEERALRRIAEARFAGTGQERCDRCAAQAWVTVRPVRGRGSLALCGHHFTASAERFAGGDWLVDDRRPWRPGWGERTTVA